MCLFPPTLVVFLPAFSQYEFDLADLAGGRQQDEGRGDGFSVIEKWWRTVGERMSIREAMHAQFVPSVGGVVQGKCPA